MEIVEQNNMSQPDLPGSKDRKLGIIIVVIVVVVLALGGVAWWWSSKPGGQKLPSEVINNQVPVVDEDEGKDKVVGKLFLEPGSVEVKKGENLTVAIYFSTGGSDLAAVSAAVTYDPKKLQLVGETDYTKASMSIGMPEEKKSGWLIMTRGQMGDGDWQDSDDGFNGDRGLMAKITFKTLESGETTIGFDTNESKLILDDAKGTAIKTELETGTYIIK